MMVLMVLVIPLMDWMVPTKQNNTIRPADGSGSGSIN